MDNLRETSFPFPIADVEEGPSVFYSAGRLELRFVDYTGTARRIRFHDVVDFHVASIDADDRHLLDDRTYLVENSTLVHKLTQAGEILDGEEYTHQIICFNETSELVEVIYREMESNLSDE